MVLTAVELGHDYLVLTDHSPRLKVANGLSVERLTRQLGVVASIDERVPDFRLLKGIEVDILDDGGLDQTPEMLDRLDVVVPRCTPSCAWPSAPMTRGWSQRCATRAPTSSATAPAASSRATAAPATRDAFDAAEVFAACAEHDVAVEINSRPERCDPPDELVAMALEAGCLFSIDSDAHAPGQLDFQVYGCARAERLGVPAERIVNTWDVDRLLAWARPA